MQRGDQEKFFKNRPKSRPRLKRLKALWRKWHYPPISMHLKCKDWRRFCGKQEAPRVLEWPSYGNLGKVTQNPHFLKKEQKGDQGKFFKNRTKGSPCLKGAKALWRKLNYTLIKMHLKCKDCTKFRRKQRLQKYPNCQLMAIFARSSKTRIF